MSESGDSFKVLYLDDSDIALSTVRHVLGAEGMRVAVANTLEDATRKCAGVDLVIIDYHMPLVNGADALTSLRAAVPRDEAPLFYLYTTDTDLAMTYKRLGFDGAFTAKGDWETLRTQFHAVRRLLKLKRFRRERAG